MIYYCKACHQVDPEGIAGHPARCKVANAPRLVVNKQPKVVSATTKHGIYKNKEKRLEYQRAWARRKRAS